MSIMSTLILPGYNFNFPYDSDVNKPFAKCFSSYEGMCISKSYYLQDGHTVHTMYIWDEELNKPREVEYSSSKIRNPDAHKSFVDASPEIILRAKHYEDKIRFNENKLQRDKLALELRKLHTLEVKAVNRWELNIHRLRELRKNTNDERYMICLKLLTLTVRNDFKKSLRSQLIEWMRFEGRRFNNLTPFTYKQWVCFEHKMKSVYVHKEN